MAATMTTVDHITNEIRQVAAYIAAQRALGLAQDKIDTCRIGMKNSIATMLNNVRSISSEDATAITNVLATSCFIDDERVHLAEAILAKTATSVSSKDVRGVGKKATRFEIPESVERFFTESDITVFSDPNLPILAKLQHAVDRLVFLRMDMEYAPAECVSADVATVVADKHYEGTFPSATEMHGHMKTLKSMFHNARPRVEFAPMSIIGPDPSKLPLQYFNACYSNEQPKNVMTVSGWHAKRKLTSCRSSNKLVRTTLPSSVATLAVLPREARGQAAGQANAPPDAMQLMAGLGAMMMSGMGGANGINPQAMMQRMQQMMQPPQLHIDVARARVGQGGQERAPMQHQLVDASSPEEERTHSPQLGAAHSPQLGAEGELAIGDGAAAPDGIAIAVEQSMQQLRPKALTKPVTADVGAVARAAVFEMELAHKAAVDASVARVAAAKSAARARATRSKPQTSVPAGPAIMKRPSSAMATARPAGRPACPAKGAAAIYYKGGKISQSDSKQGWRVWPDASNVGRESVVRFGPDRASSWDAALDRIEKRPRK